MSVDGVRAINSRMGCASALFVSHGPSSPGADFLAVPRLAVFHRAGVVMSARPVFFQQ